MTSELAEAKRKYVEQAMHAKKRKQKKMDSLLKQLDEQKTANRPSNNGRVGEIGRNYTLSIALPGSILNNAQTFEMRCYLAGQIARAAALFCVDEVVVFDETAQLTSDDCQMIDHGQHRPGDGNALLVKILRYLECPQYLRKRLFPLSKDLRCAGLLNPLCCSHHFGAAELDVPFREAVVTASQAGTDGGGGLGSLCFAGFSKQVQIDKTLQPGTRVTVELTNTDKHAKVWKGRVVNPLKPVQTLGHYWGYTVRIAKGLGAALKDSPHGWKYDLVIGTSDKGDDISSVRIDAFNHMLIVFGGLGGLQTCLENDASLKSSHPRQLFDHYVNVCPKQGCRTIRTEEAILIALTALQSKISSSIPFNPN